MMKDRTVEGEATKKRRAEDRDRTGQNEVGESRTESSLW